MTCVGLHFLLAKYNVFVLKGSVYRWMVVGSIAYILWHHQGHNMSQNKPNANNRMRHSYIDHLTISQVNETKHLTTSQNKQNNINHEVVSHPSNCLCIWILINKTEDSSLHTLKSVPKRQMKWIYISCNNLTVFKQVLIYLSNKPYVVNDMTYLFHLVITLI